MTNFGAPFDVETVLRGKERTHGQTLTPRGTLETDRTALAASEAPAVPVPRAQTHRQSQGPDRHPVRAQDRPPLGGSAPGDGLRQRHGLLATAARPAGAPGLAEAHPS